jgi:hypothetical protein
MERENVIEALTGMLLDAAVNVRIQAIHAVAKSGATTSLIPMLRDEAMSVRQHAAATLGKIGDKRALSELQRVAAKDFEASVRCAAVRALEQILRFTVVSIPFRKPRISRMSFTGMSSMRFSYCKTWIFCPGSMPNVFRIVRGITI